MTESTYMRNPFKPTAGATPPVLIGRQSVIDEFQVSLDDGVGAPYRLMYVTGARGVGKTVMLTALGDVAKRNGWKVIDETAEPGFLKRLGDNLAFEQRRRITGYELPSGGISFPANGIQASLNLGKIEFDNNNPDVSLRHLIGDELNQMDENNQGILVTLDEVQDSSLNEIRSLAICIQHLIRDKRNIAFVFAGLPTMVDTVINDSVITFLRRAECEHLGSVDKADIWSAFEKTISQSGKRADYEVLNRMTEATNGYPFMIQLVGYWTWRYSEQDDNRNEISLEDVSKGIDRARLRLGSMVHGPQFDHLSSMAKDYLIAMSQDDGPSSTREIAERLHRDAQYANVYRTMLIGQDIIEQVRQGYVDFKIPYMRDYLKEHVAHHQMRMDIEKMRNQE